MEAAELAARRDALGLSQRQLAERFGVHYLTVSKWERGLHRIPDLVDLALMTLERHHDARADRRAEVRISSRSSPSSGL